MKTDNVIKDTTLTRQLKRLGLTEAEVPKDLNAWCQFLLRIEQTYKEFENSRYTNERTLMLVSKEMQELFESLENAERISSTGSWSFNLKTKVVRWSSEMYRILGREQTKPGLEHEGYMLLVHPEDRKIYEEAWNKAIKFGEAESVHRVVLGTETRWVQIRYRRFLNENNIQTDIIGGTLTDITKQKEAELRLADLNAKLIATAKRAGMAEIATSVLHNIGNVLNSLSVSSEIINNIIFNTKISNLMNISELMKEHKDNLGHYLTMDPKGKLIPAYLESLAMYWIEEKKDLNLNLSSLNTHIQHIKEIVAKQQSLTGKFGVVQPVLFSDLLDDAVSIVFSGIENKGAKIHRNYQYFNKVLVDKVSYLEILINLIGNAKDSLEVSNQVEKQIILSIELKSPDTLTITIEDNGSGIAPENFQKLFNYGFTTKRMGSGIGLHASILSIREMGGDIKAYSEGVGKGAKFVLEIPNKLHSVIK